MEAGIILAGYLECDDRGLVAGYEILSALSEIPGIALSETLEACLGQVVCQFMNSMETGRTLFDKRNNSSFRF